MKVSTRTDPVILECAGCGITREVPRGASLRTFHMHVNRFKNEHTTRCETRAQFNREYENAGRVAAMAIRHALRTKK